MASRRREIAVERECARVTIDAVKNGVLISTEEHGLMAPFAIAKSGRELEAVLRAIKIRLTPTAGHLIAAQDLAQYLGTPIVQASTEPVASE